MKISQVSGEDLCVNSGFLRPANCSIFKTVSALYGLMDMVLGATAWVELSGAKDQQISGFVIEGFCVIAWVQSVCAHVDARLAYSVPAKDSAKRPQLPHERAQRVFNRARPARFEECTNNQQRCSDRPISQHLF